MTKQASLLVGCCSRFRNHHLRPRHPLHPETKNYNNKLGP